MDNGYCLISFFFHIHIVNIIWIILSFGINFLFVDRLYTCEKYHFLLVIKHLLKEGIEYYVLIIYFINQHQKYNERISICTILTLHTLYFALKQANFVHRFNSLVNLVEKKVKDLSEDFINFEL